MTARIGDVYGVILAGGRSSRMGGGDKTLLPLGGEALLGRIVARLRPQVGQLAINANGDAGPFAAYGLPLLRDGIPGHAGPLAGILAALEWAGGSGYGHVLTVPGDAPFLPEDLVQGLAAQVPSNDGIAVASSLGRRHPVIALWPVSIAADLASFLRDQPSRRVNDFLARHAVVEVAFDPCRIGSAEIDAFFNVNTPDDLAHARRLIETDPL